MILDVGAQVVGPDNAEVAWRWLEQVREPDVRAAIFFDDSENLCVMDRGGRTEPFLTSSYAANTASCLVFLDDAHTRGTDLRLPGNYRAAVTLGPALTKDRLVQGTY